MKLALPNKHSVRGFTLVELMVAIAIVAILATVGLTIFTGSQKSARDTKRRSDIQAIAAAFESHYLPVASTCDGDEGDTAYTQPSYCPLIAGWFAGNAVPTDPVGSSKMKYCIKSGADGFVIPDLTSSWTSINCPTGWSEAVAGAPTAGAYGDANAFNVFKVCARLETNNTPICVGSQQL